MNMISAYSIASEIESFVEALQGGIFLGFIIYLAIMAGIAKVMETVAADKGYGKEAHVWLICFFLGIVGVLYVVALPDKKQQEQNEIIIKQNQKIIRLLSDKEDKVADATSAPPVKHLLRCDKCGTMIEEYPCAHCGYNTMLKKAAANTTSTAAKFCEHCGALIVNGKCIECGAERK